jgi:hypothetical protein
MYSPTLGRWMQMDPARYVDGADIYQFGLSNPEARRDPMGLTADDGAGVINIPGPESSNVLYDPQSTLVFGPGGRGAASTSRTYGFAVLNWSCPLPVHEAGLDIYTEVSLSWRVNANPNEVRAQNGGYHYFIHAEVPPHVEFNLSSGPGQNAGVNLDRKISPDDLNKYADRVSSELTSDNTSGTLDATFIYRAFCRPLKGTFKDHLTNEDGMESESNVGKGKPNRQRVAYRIGADSQEQEPAGWNEDTRYGYEIHFHFDWKCDAAGRPISMEGSVQSYAES